MELLFIICLPLFIISFPFTVLEIILSRLFVSFMFSLGIPIYNKHIILSTPNSKIILNHIYKLNYGKYKFTSYNTCMLISKFQLFKILNLNTLFPFKCEISWNTNNATLHARIPLGPTYLFLYIVFEQIIELFTSFKSSSFIFILSIILIVIIQVLIEYYMVDNMLDELRDFLDNIH